MRMETCADSFSLLQLIANDCYKVLNTLAYTSRSFHIHYHLLLQMGQFFYSAKAFDVLEKLDPNPEYWEGKRGACIGHFQLVIAGREPK